MRPLRRLLSRGDSLHKKLRKAVANGKPRVVAELLEAGASPTWMEGAVDSSDELNALLLACHHGHVEILDLLLDAFFASQQMLHLWGRHMYYIVIRNGHWKAFRRIYDRKVPLDPVGSSVRSKLPAPMFIAAEVGQSHILQFLVKAQPVDAASYSFNGHSLLSIASKNGHYECVDVLLSMLMIGDEALDFAIEVARNHAHAHVVVLLTSCLPQYNSNPEPVVVGSTSTRSRRPSVTFNFDQNYSYSRALSGSGGTRSSFSKPRRSSLSQNRQRASLAETDIISSDGDEDQQPRRSSTWLYETEQDLTVYHPYLESDDDELAKDAEEARQYEAYIQGLDASESEDQPDWTSTPPVPSSSIAAPPRSRSLSIESEEKTEETLARIAERREATKLTAAQKQKISSKKKRTWLYHNEVILPYEESDESTTSATTATTVTPHNSPPQPPKSGKPPLPPPSNVKSRRKSFQLPPTITQVSRKVISLRSTSMPLGRASM